MLFEMFSDVAVEETSQFPIISAISVVALIILSLLMAKRYNPLHALISLIVFSGMITMIYLNVERIGIDAFYDTIELINNGTSIFFYQPFQVFVSILESFDMHFGFITITNVFALAFATFIASQGLSTLSRINNKKRRNSLRQVVPQSFSYYHPKFNYHTQLNQSQLSYQQMIQQQYAQHQASQMQAQQQQMQTQQQMAQRLQQQMMQQQAMQQPRIIAQQQCPMLNQQQNLQNNQQIMNQISNPFGSGRPATQKPMDLPISPQPKPMSHAYANENPSVQAHGLSGPNQQQAARVPYTQTYVQRQANTTPLSQGMNQQMPNSGQFGQTPSRPQPRIPNTFRQIQNPMVLDKE